MLGFIRRTVVAALVLGILAFLFAPGLFIFRRFHHFRPKTATTEEFSYIGNLSLLRFGPNDFELRGVCYPTNDPTEISRVAAIGRESGGEKTFLIVRQLPEVSPTGRPILPKVEHYWRVNLETDVRTGPLTASDVARFAGPNPVSAIEFVEVGAVFESLRHGRSKPRE